MSKQLHEDAVTQALNEAISDRVLPRDDLRAILEGAHELIEAQLGALEEEDDYEETES